MTNTWVESGVTKQTRGRRRRRRREGDVFRWKRKYSSPPLATFSRSRLLRRFFACHFLDPVSFFSLPSLQFFIPPFSTSCTNPHLLFPRCFELHPPRSSLSWKETKLASPKARLIQVRGRDRALPFYGPSRNRCFERFYRSLHTNSTISRTWLFTQVLVKDVSTIACVNVYHAYFVFIFTRIVISLYPKTPLFAIELAIEGNPSKV